MLTRIDALTYSTLVSFKAANTNQPWTNHEDDTMYYVYVYCKVCIMIHYDSTNDLEEPWKNQPHRMNRLHSLLVQHHILRLQVSVNDLVGIQMRPNMWKCLTILSDLDDSHTSAWVPYMPRSWLKTNVRRLCGLDRKPDVRASEKVSNFREIIQSKTILCNGRH